MYKVRSFAVAQLGIFESTSDALPIQHNSIAQTVRKTGKNKTIFLLNKPVASLEASGGQLEVL